MTTTEKNELRSVIELTARYRTTFWLNRLAGIVHREFSRTRETISAWLDAHPFLVGPANYIWGFAIGTFTGWMLWGK
jgi:hypothetical protein